MTDVPTLGSVITNAIQRHRFVLTVWPCMCFIIALLYILIRPVSYEAYGLMEVTPHSLDTSPLATTPLTLPNDSLVLSQVEILKSSAVLRRAADDLHIPFALLQRSVTITPLGRSFVIRVAAKARTPEHAQKTANAVMEAYQMHQRDLKTQRVSDTSRWLNDHVTDLAAHMRQSAQNAASYRKMFNLDDGLVTKQQINDLASQFVKVQMDLTEAQATQASSTMQNDKALNQQLSSPVLIGLTQQDALLRQKMGELQQKYGPRHPDRQAAQAELDALQAKKAQEINRLNKSVQQSAQIANEKIDKLHKQFALLQDKTHHDDEQAIQLQSLEDEANVTRILYEAFLQRSKEVGLSADLNSVGAQIVSRADLPLHPADPNGFIILLLSTCAGLFVGLITLIVSEQLASPIREADR
jgi:succinoglycan biosynthesis transport protein ExoP